MAIAVGSTWVGTRLYHRFLRRKQPAVLTEPGEPQTLPGLDYRIVAIGALVPDLIDKPLKWFLLPSLPDDHTYGHTLLLPTILILAGLLWARRGDARLLALGLGCLSHPLVDPVIVYPRTLFWPLLGPEFPVITGIPGWYLRLADLMLIGIAIAVWRREWFSRIRMNFLRHGTLDPRSL